MRVSHQGTAVDNKSVLIDYGTNFKVDYSENAFNIFYKAKGKFWCLPVPEDSGIVDTSMKTMLAIPEFLSLVAVYYNGNEHMILTQRGNNQFYLIQVSTDLKTIKTTDLSVPIRHIKNATMTKGPNETSFITYSDWCDKISDTIAHTYRVKGLIYDQTPSGIENNNDNGPINSAASIKTIRQGIRPKIRFQLFIPSISFDNSSVPVRFEIFTSKGQLVQSITKDIKTGSLVIVPIEDIVSPQRLSSSVYFMKVRIGHEAFLLKIIHM